MGRAPARIGHRKGQEQPGKPALVFIRAKAVLVCVAVQNGLGAQYIRRVLAREKAFQIAAIDDLARQVEMQKGVPIFILDSGGLDFPLGECLRILNSKYPGARYIVLHQIISSEATAQLLALGIHGAVAYEQVENDLVPAIRSVAEGRLWIPDNVLQIYVQNSTRAFKNEQKPSTWEPMTARENQVAELIKRRFSNKEIAAMLNIQESTVKFHLSNIFSKLRISCRGELLNKNPADELWRKMLAS
jgi:two-component system nitrate/nitrite response regulator NarL